MKLYNTSLLGKPISTRKLWESLKDETIQHFFIGKAYFKVGNCGKALKMNLYNTSLSGKPISNLESVGGP